MYGTYPIGAYFWRQHKQNFQTDRIHDNDFRVISITEKSNVFTTIHVVWL